MGLVLSIALTNARPPSRGVRALMESSREADRLAVEYVRRMTNADISSHRPEDLRIVDDVLDEYFREAMKQRTDGEGAPALFGSYLGEVFVRNLGARWRYPSAFQALRVALSRNRNIAAERYWYVLLGDQKAYVFEAARKAIDRTGADFSLYDFYQRYAQGNRISSPEMSRQRQ